LRTQQEMVEKGLSAQEALESKSDSTIA